MNTNLRKSANIQLSIPERIPRYCNIGP